MGTRRDAHSVVADFTAKAGFMEKSTDVSVGGCLNAQLLSKLPAGTRELLANPLGPHSL